MVVVVGVGIAIGKMKLRLRYGQLWSFRDLSHCTSISIGIPPIYASNPSISKPHRSSTQINIKFNPIN